MKIALPLPGTTGAIVITQHKDQIVECVVAPQGLVPRGMGQCDAGGL